MRGPVEGIPLPLMPVAHALLHAEEEVVRVTADLADDLLWRHPGGAASIGFHLKHIAGSLDRLLTYARGEQLNSRQREALADEQKQSADGVQSLVHGVRETIGQALALLRNTDPDRLLDQRLIGRAKLPSTLLGVLFHAAEHTQRHVGQLVTTIRVLQGETGRGHPHA